MIIFIGGLRAHDARKKYESTWPDVEFLFADIDDPLQEWVRLAMRADVAVINRNMCNHKTIDALRKRSQPTLFANSKLGVFNLVQEIMKHGAPSHSYVRPAGSESVAFTVATAAPESWCDLPRWVEEVGAGDDHRESVIEREEG